MDDKDYSPAYQDEYQRLWHKAAAERDALEQKVERLTMALRGWEARDVGRGYSVIERGEGATVEHLAGPIEYQQAEKIEDWIEALSSATTGEESSSALGILGDRASGDAEPA